MKFTARRTIASVAFGIAVVLALLPAWGGAINNDAARGQSSALDNVIQTLPCTPEEL